MKIRKDLQGIPIEKWSANDFADLYRYDWGINCVPSNGCQLYKGENVPPNHRPEAWKEWQDKPIPLEIHDKWKKENKFDQGIMRITGPVWHNESLKDYIYASIDCDNKCAISEFIDEDLTDAAKKHLIEMHLGTSDKLHWDFYISKNSKLKPKASDAQNPDLKEAIIKNEIPSFEVKIGNGVMFGAPSKHPDGTRYEFLGLNIPVIMTGADKIQDRIESIYKKYNMIPNEPGKDKISVHDMVQTGVVIQEGHNRSQGILRFVESISKRLDELEMDDSYFVESAFWFAKEHTAPGYSDERIQSIAEQAIQFVKEKEKEENDMTYRRLMTGHQEWSVDADCEWLVRHMVKKLKIINKSEIISKIQSWFLRVIVKAKKYKPTDKDDDTYRDVRPDFNIKGFVKNIFNDIDIIESLIKLAVMYAKMKEPILLDKDQHVEAAIYCTVRFHVKRHGLDGRLIYFNGIKYDDKTEAFLYRHIQHLMIRPKSSDLQQVYNSIKNEAKIITLAEMKAHSHLVCLLNGVYNIKTGEFSSEFSPDYYIFDQIPYNYNPEQEYPEIKTFVDSMITDKTDKQFYFDFGSICFHPYNGINFQLGLVGPPGTGKTELNRLVQRCFDEDSVHDARIQKISDDATIRIDVALGRVNIDGDMTDLNIKEISNTKKFISQEAFTDRAIYDHSGKYYPSSRLMFSANSLYELPNDADAEAIYDRTKLIQFTKKFRHTDEEKKNLVYNIPKEEFDGYVAFLLNNAHDIWVRKDTKYRLDPIEAENIWNEVGNFVKNFLRKYLVKDYDSNAKAQDIHRAWEKYTINNNVRKTIKQTEFYALSDKILGQQRDKVRVTGDEFPVWGYSNLRLLNDEEIAAKEQQQL